MSDEARPPEAPLATDEPLEPGSPRPPEAPLATDEPLAPAEPLAPEAPLATDEPLATAESLAPGIRDEPLERPTEARLARLHLRTGAFALARAELETLAGQGTLDDAALVDLAEVRWRTDDLMGAGEAAQAYLATGRDDPTALAIAAEAAAALGRPGEARRLATRALAATEVPLDVLFAGIPRSPIWPTDARQGEPAAELFPVSRPASGSPAGTGRGAGGARTDGTGRGGRASAAGDAAAARPASMTMGFASAGGPASPPGELGSIAAAAAGRGSTMPWATAVQPEVGAEQGDVPGRVGAGPATAAGAAMAGAETAASASDPRLWTEEEVPTTAEPLPDPNVELAAARAAVAAGDHAAAALHLGMVLRLDPTLAPAVLNVVGQHHSPVLEMVRGDAFRLVGHEAEARRAYAAAARGLAGPTDDRRP